MKSTSRRSFLKQAGAAGLTAPLFVRNLMSAPPSRRVSHASFGAGGMAGSDLGSISSHASVQIVAVADVDSSRLGAIEKRYPGAHVYQDWRVLLDKEGR